MVRMSEESNERYVLEIGTGIVAVWDNVRMETARVFEGPERLLAATAELNRLRERDELGPYVKPEIAPAEFLAKTLPAVARRQRLESHLAEVIEIEAGLAEVLAVDAANLKRATALREKLEKELASPLSATETAQNAPEVVADTEERLERYMAAWERQGQYSAIGQMPSLFKPQPY